MSVLLQYEFQVGSLSPLARAFKSAERMAEQSAKNEERIRSRVVAKERPKTARVTLDPQKKALDDLSKYGQVRMRQELKERERLDKKAHDSRIRMIDKERREAIAAERARDRVRRATIGSVATSAFRSTVGVGKAILGATGIAGGAIAASRIGPGIDLEHRQRQVLRNARGAGQENAYTPDELRSRIAATSVATGASQEDITGGVEAFVQRTGDIKTAVENMQNFATVSAATGASVSDLASVAADLSQKFDIKGPEEMADALSVLAFQGKKGAFELRDMANTFPELAAAAARAGMTGTGGMRLLGGLAQISRSVTGSGEEASTALQMALGQIVAKGSKIESGKAFGRSAKVFTDKSQTKLRDMRTVLADVIGASRGNLPQLEEVFDKRGIRAISPLITTFTAASDAAGGGKRGETAGREAVLKAIDDAVNATGDFKDVQVDAANALKDTSAQLEILNTKLTDSVRTHLLPALIELVPKLEPLIPKFGEMLDVVAKWIGWLSEHPAEGLGLAIIGTITKDLIAANIGTSIATAIAGSIAASRGAEAAGAIGSGLAGLAGNAVASGGMLAGARAGLAGAAGASAGAAIAMTVGSIALAAGTVYMANDQNDKLKSETGGLGAGDLLAGLFSGKGIMQQVNAQMDAQAKAAKAQEDAAAALKDSAIAIKGAAGAMQPGSPTGPSVAPNRGANPTDARL